MLFVGAMTSQPYSTLPVVVAVVAVLAVVAVIVVVVVVVLFKRRSCRRLVKMRRFYIIPFGPPANSDEYYL